MPPIKRGDDARVKLAETRDALKQCNWNTVEGRKWYEQVRARSASGKGH